MHFKKGPNNTERAYDPRNGQYVSYSKMLLENKTQNLTRKERAEKRLKAKREILNNLAFKSKDIGLLEAYKAIEESIPESINHVNQHFFDSNIGATREIDLYAAHAIIEVKSGIVHGRTKQFQDQKRFAESKNKEFIVYAPQIGKHLLKYYKDKQINIVTNTKDLVDLYKSYKIKKEGK